MKTQQHQCKRNVNKLKSGRKISKSIFLLFLLSLYIFAELNAQTFPSPSSCTSKDLELVGATLPGNNPCNSCTPGTSETRILNLAIYNKTGSVRTSFAFWGTLEVYDSDGTLNTSQSGPISACVGPIPKNSTTTFPSIPITYQCGQSLRITNLFLAWTDASPNSTCPSLLGSPSTINPKCGTLPRIQIIAGVDADMTITQTTCTSNGSIVVSPYGGVGPYSVTIGSTTYNNVTTSATFSNLTQGTYSIIITDSRACSTTKSRTINPPANKPFPPTSGGDQEECASSPIQTLTATATSSGTVTWYTAASGGSLVANPTLNSVGTVTYYAQATLGSCISDSRTAVSLTINPTPAAPVSGGDQTECEASPIQTLTATASGSGTISWHTASSGGSVVANPILNSVGTVTYYAQATLGSCVSATRTAVNLTINPTPAAPVSGGNKTECAATPVQTLTATASGSGTISWHTAASGGSVVANPTLSSVGTATYYAQATLGSCPSLSRTPVTLTIYANPAAPSICVTEPSLCGPSTGSVTITQPLGAGYQYSIDNGATWQSSAVFNNLQAGSVSGIKVKDANGCISGSANCSQSSCQSALRNASEVNASATGEFIERSVQISPVEKASVVAFPNPFNEKVKFTLIVPKDGIGSLEIFDITGRKAETVQQGFLRAGTYDFEISMSEHPAGYYLYKFIIGDQQISGKLINSKYQDKN